MDAAADGGEQVEPWLLHQQRRVQRWQRGHVTHWACQYVTLAELPDGRWLVDHSDVKVGCRAYHSEARARQVVAEHTAGDGWREVPAAYNPDTTPVGDGWVRRGGTWWRDGASEQAADQG